MGSGCIVQTRFAFSTVTTHTKFMATHGMKTFGTRRKRKMHNHKEERLQVLVDFYRADWLAMIKQIEEAEERAAYWHDQYMNSVTGSNVKV